MVGWGTSAVEHESVETGRFDGAEGDGGACKGMRIAREEGGSRRLGKGVLSGYKSNASLWEAKACSFLYAWMGGGGNRLFLSRP